VDFSHRKLAGLLADPHFNVLIQNTNQLLVAQPAKSQSSFPTRGYELFIIGTTTFDAYIAFQDTTTNAFDDQENPTDQAIASLISAMQDFGSNASVTSVSDDEVDDIITYMGFTP